MKCAAICLGTMLCVYGAFSIFDDMKRARHGAYVTVVMQEVLDDLLGKVKP